MSDGPKVVFLALFGLVSALSVSPCLAQAKFTAPEPKIADTTWAAMDVTAALNRVLNESKDSGALREKTVQRIAECSLMYGGLSTLTANLEAKKSYVQAQEATMEVETAISKPLQTPRRIELEETARRSVALLLRTVKAEGTKQVAPLLKSCKALNDVKEMKAALQELAAQ
jgi:hypothetical protein